MMMTMKFSLSALSLFFLVSVLPDASAFQSPAGIHRRSLNLKSSVSSDNDLAAVQAALQATEQYGATSQQARVLWDVVEELRSADNSPATKPSLADECLLDENGINEACMEYDFKMAQLIDLTSYVHQRKIFNVIGVCSFTNTYSFLSIVISVNSKTGANSSRSNTCLINSKRSHMNLRT